MNRFLTFCLVVVLSTSTVSAGGGWTQPKGAGYFKLGQYFIIANNYFTPAGDVVGITTTAFYSTSLYGEFGITDRFTTVIYLPFYVRSTLNKIEDANGNLVQEGDQVNSIGDVDISLKYGIIDHQGFVGALSLTLGLPLGEPSGGSTGLLQTGDGEFNQILSLDLSRSFNEGKMYASLNTGFNNRSKNYSDEFRYGAEFGIRAGNAWIINRLYGIKSFFNGDDTVIANNGIFSNNLEYLSYSPEVAWDVRENLGLTLGAGFAFFGKRVLAAPSFSAGIYLKI